MRTPTVALAMIVKGVDAEAPLLAKCLENVSHHVDAIYINLNHRPGEVVSPKLLKLCRQYDAVVRITEWHDSFVEARNYIYDQIPKEYAWILWLDADDTVYMPHKIKEVISIVSKNVGGIFAAYDYAHDDLGNVTYTHWVIRLSRNNGAYKWKSSFDDGGVSVHETLQDIRTSTNVRVDGDGEFKVVHGSNPERSQQSLKRNIELLEGMYQRQLSKGKVDPRVLYYLATHCFEAAGATNTDMMARAEDLLTEYLQLSGWAEERSEAWVYMGLIFRLQQRNDAARQAFGHAILENPANPKPYIELGELEYLEKRFATSEEWLLAGIAKKTPTTSTVIMPMENTFRAYLLLAQTYVNMGFTKLDEAQEYITKALKLRPTDDDAKNAQELIESLQETRDNTKAFLRLSRIVREPSKLVDILPNDMQDNPAILNIRQKYSEAHTWDKKDVVIFCGNSAQGIWNWEDLDKTGMGGSEEAVIKMSRELDKLGYRVTIYATPGDKAGFDPEGEYIEWKQYWEFNPKDEFNIIIAWRNPWFFDADIKAKKAYLWLHDVMDKEEFTFERLDRISGVFFVSQYHADLYKDTIPTKKRIVSGNGITPEDFDKYDNRFKRNPHRLIYTSSQLRGLEILLDIWPEIKAEIPDATLDTYYGWETFDEGNKHNPERMAWKDKIIRQMRGLSGVTDHGRIGQDELNKELTKSGIFAYPCWFPEVYCISLIKAMAAGCYPITSDFAVLKDFNQWGLKVPYKYEKMAEFKQEYKETLLRTLHRKDPERILLSMERRKKVRDLYSWERTAQGWKKQFNKGS